MGTAILIVATIFIAATNAAPLNKRCMELSNSIGPYDYCNKTTNTSQGDDGLKNLIILANDVADTFVRICSKSENKKVSTCSARYISYKELSNIALQICQATCNKPDNPYNLESDRDVQNDRINSQLEILLEHQQQWNVTCDVEADSGNSSFSDVCATIKLRLHILTQHMIDYVSNCIS